MDVNQYLEIFLDETKEHLECPDLKAGAGA